MTANGSAALEYVPCALCGADDAPAVLRGRDLRRGIPGDFTVVRCRDCGLAYVNPRPTPSLIGRYYPEGYAPHQAQPPSWLEQLYYHLFRRLPAAPGARILDVGCGGGKYLTFLRERGYEVTGIELNAEVAHAVTVNLGFDVRAGEISGAGLERESFDVITLWWVLEHTHDPIGTLREAHHLCKPGGTLVVGLQNFASLARLVFGARWHHLDLPGHLYQFEPRTLREALRVAGFRIIRLRQDLLAKDFAPSIGFVVGAGHAVDNPLANMLALPLDLFAWAVRRSGLMTAYAVPI
jgi:SAM-dependent methyltransferase